jgi:hypothetical protein
MFCVQIRFQDDSIDETNEVEAALVGGDTHSADSRDSPESSSDNAHSLDVRVLDLAGDHVRPLVPEPPELPADCGDFDQRGTFIFILVILVILVIVRMGN